jgi:hypothetical protein
LGSSPDTLASAVTFIHGDEIAQLLLVIHLFFKKKEVNRTTAPRHSPFFAMKSRNYSFFFQKKKGDEERR